MGGFLKWAIIIGLAWWAVSDPHAAAAFVHHVVHAASVLMSSL